MNSHDGTPQQGDDKPKAHLHIDDLRAAMKEPAGGMSIGRYEEIAEAKAEGREIDITAEEEKEFEELAESMKDIGRRLGRSFLPNFDGIFKSLNAAASIKPKTPNKPNPEEFIPLAARRPNFNPQPAINFQALEDAAAEKAALDEADRQRSQLHLNATVKLANIMEAQAKENKTAGKHQRRMNWAILLTTAASVLVGIIAIIVTISSGR